MNRIEWKQKAVRQLLRLPAPWQVRIRDAVGALRAFPNTPNVKVLKDYEFSHRLRVGRYRVLFEFDGRIKIVTIEEVKKRDDHTY